MHPRTWSYQQSISCYLMQAVPSVPCSPPPVFFLAWYLLCPVYPSALLLTGNETVSPPHGLDVLNVFPLGLTSQFEPWIIVCFLLALKLLCPDWRWHFGVPMQCSWLEYFILLSILCVFLTESYFVIICFSTLDHLMARIHPPSWGLIRGLIVWLSSLLWI